MTMRNNETGPPTDPASCFVVAPAALSIGPIVDILSAHGWRAFALTDVASLGSSLTSAVQKAISQADLVLAILPAGADALNVAIETGMALALGKRVAAVVPPELDLPSALTNALVIRAEPDNLRAIVFALDQVRGRISEAPDIETTGPYDHPVGPDASEMAAYASRLIKHGRESDIVALLARAIQASGAASVVSEGLAGDFRFDLGVWSDDLHTIDGNPLLIEFKRRLSESAVQQVASALHQAPSVRLGLIVYIEEAPTGPINSRYPVLTIRLIELIERLRSESFAQIVRELRNRTVHGPGH